MGRTMRPRRSTIIIFIIGTSVFLLTKCIDNQKENDKTTAIKTAIKNVSFEQFAGSEKCAKCHKNIFESHINTGHYLTSQPASEESIKGSFKAGKNKYVYNPNLDKPEPNRKDA